MTKGIVVDSIVAMRDKQPYVRLFAYGAQVAQLSMAQARDVAHNILTQCARAEADAMINLFFAAHQFPEAALAELMMHFRDFRQALDNEKVERRVLDPDTGREVPKPQ